MARPTGFEPVSECLEGISFNPLSYGRVFVTNLYTTEKELLFNFYLFLFIS
jgi:hypothetical protein